MDPGTRFGKTDLGRQEMARRSGALSAVERRLLILIDGTRSLNDLGAFVRVGELERALERLLALGMVASEAPPAVLNPSAGEGFSAPTPLEAPRPATDPGAFVAVRDEVERFVRNRLGDSGKPICAAIGRCRNPQELRALLRGIEVFVGQRLDAQTTQAFARHFGSLLL